MTTHEFIEKSKSIHGEMYDYSKVYYKGAHHKVTIICPIHGEFNQMASSHYYGSGCSKCGTDKQREAMSNNASVDRYKNIIQPKTYKVIPLTRGKNAIIDNEDFDIISSINWHYSSGYAKNTAVGSMHRFVISAEKNMEVDHINGDKLDNRKSNLRQCNRQQNQFNTRSRLNYSSKYKGIGWNKGRKKWRARIGLDGELIDLGLFSSEIEAAKAYDKKAIELFGEFAYLNFK